MPISSPIVTGEDYTADDINNLRTDVLSGHTHDGTEGVKMPFKNLAVTGTDGSTRPAGGNVSYDEIETHVAASQGAHGINASVYVVGSPTADAVIVAGSSSLDGDSKNIDFGFTFNALPHVVACYTAQLENSSSNIDAIWIDNITTSSCIVHTSSDSWYGKPFSWIAVGVSP